MMAQTLLDAQDSPEASETLLRAPVQTVESVDQLKKINVEGVEAVIWNRVLPEYVQNWFESSALKEGPDAREILEINEVYEYVESYFGDPDLAPEEVRTWLINDIALLAKQISAQFGASHIQLRIEDVRDNACRRFHIDTVQARLVCTYFGPGTEYGLSDDEDTAPVNVSRVQTGMAILFKGKLWQGDNQKRLKHRSPPIEGLGLSRLVVVIEPASPI